MENFIQEIHFDCDTVWKKKIVDVLLSINDNEKLLDFVFSKQEPDDYDGCFTTNGEFYAKKSVQFLKWKLSTETSWLIPIPSKIRKMQIVSCSKCKSIEDEFEENEIPEEYGWLKKGKKWYCSPCALTLRLTTK